MTDELKECVELLERIRDTYLANHQTEKVLITAVVERARKSVKTEPKPEVAEKRKYAKHGKV